MEILASSIGTTRRSKYAMPRAGNPAPEWPLVIPLPFCRQGSGPGLPGRWPEAYVLVPWPTAARGCTMPLARQAETWKGGTSMSGGRAGHTRVDLSGAEIIDNHVHGFRIEDLLANDPQDFETRLNLLGTLFSDSTLTSQAGRADPGLWQSARDMTESTVFSLAARRMLAERLGCEPTADAVAAARDKAFRDDPIGYIRALLEDAGVAGLLVDDGFPLPRVPSREFRETVGGTPVHRVARIETMIVNVREPAKDRRGLEEG